jgi:hypothetical protein
MALPGGSLDSGAVDTCEDCGVDLALRVCRSGAGFYISS